MTSTPYRIAYAVGFTPWEKAGRADGAHLERLIEREERERGAPGRALDIGCGTGMHTETLARRGWEVTAVDLVDRALTKARGRLASSGLTARIVKADATVLPVEVVGEGFDLFLDVGCFHGLNPVQQAAMARSVTRLATPDSTLLLLAFGKPIGPPFMPSGATREQIEAAFAAWMVVEARKPAADVAAMPLIARRADPTIYRLRLRGT